jgi:hypothetical protein
MEAYCPHCGKPMTPEGFTAKRNRPALVLIIVLVLLIGGASWYFYSQHAAYADADNAIEAAASACGAGSRSVLADRLVAAEQAIRALPSEDQGTYEVKLHNRLKFILCE